MEDIRKLGGELFIIVHGGVKKMKSFLPKFGPSWHVRGGLFGPGLEVGGEFVFDVAACLLEGALQRRNLGLCIDGSCVELNASEEPESNINSWVDEQLRDVQLRVWEDAQLFQMVLGGWVEGQTRECIQQSVQAVHGDFRAESEVLQGLVGLYDLKVG